nr:hypothetical protein [Tanacetum cinerariifolium]
MSTQQDIYAANFKKRPPMLNKENYVLWSSCLLRYANSRPNGKLIYNSIINGPYVRQMTPELGDPYCEVPVNETFHEQIDEELTEKELKQERFTSTDEESIKSYYHRFSKLMNYFERNKHFPEKIASNLKFLNNLQPEWSRHVTIIHQTKDLHTTDYTQLYDFLKYNYKEVDDLRAERLAKTHDPLVLVANSNNPYNYPSFYLYQPSPSQDKHMQMVGGNGGNQSRQYAGQNNVRNQNGLIVVSGIANQNSNKNGNIVAVRAEGNANRNNDLNEIKEVSANCILMANLQQASTSGTQTDKAQVYDSDGLAENDSNVIFEVSSVEQDEGTVEQHPTTVEEACAYFESFHNNLAIEVEKVNTVNRKLRETNANLTTELARYKNQKKCFEISKKYDKPEKVLSKVCLSSAMYY